ncbi:MAG: hypothetical protein R6W99_08565 [Clostridia bacterium]
MGLTALILGIIAVLMSLVPFCNYIGMLPAVLGIVFGVMSLMQNEASQYNSKAIAITGIVFCTAAIAFSIIWTFLLIFPLRYVIY